MKTLKFKTTINCSGCINKATPFLNEAAGKENWAVDIQNPHKILTVVSGENINEEKIVTALKDAGYKAEKLA